VKRGWKYNAEWVRDWCDIVEDALECRAVIYTAKWAVDAYLRKAPARALDEIVVRPLWLADYDGYPDDEVAPWSEWTIWQYTGSGKVPGVRGKCDRNWLAGGGLDRIRWSSVRCEGRP
jgi:lysozyme